MAEEQTGQERTEQPTERRLQEARKKGQVPRSKELNTMLSLLLAAISLLVFGGYISQNLMQISVEGFSIPRELAFDTAQLPFQFMYMASQALLALSPFMAIMLVSVFAGPLLMGGWSFSLETISFKLEKLDPIKGLARIFSLKSLVELAKALAKFVLLLGAAILVFFSIDQQLLSLTSMTPKAAGLEAATILVQVLLILSATMILIVALDVPFELWNHSKQLRMTKQEIKDEMKETDGNPQVKQRIRTLQRQLAEGRMMEDVKTADVVITNPTHYAVALQYLDRPGSAPKVVAKGKDLTALRIRSIATDCDIPIFEAPPLARALYRSTEIGYEIPHVLYMAVARVLAYVFQLKSATPTDYVPKPTDFDIPVEALGDNDEGEVGRDGN
ncbi:flagellar biosynthesis protein FlhB [Luminiphilus sp.]|nr:flagellar biosynthesis protein FlhB [Luminiphilus sp.]MDA9625504.1 flagellar biosynthesis protein FlhB [Luminiphilus sp.]